MRSVHAALVAALAVLFLHFGSLAQAELRVFVAEQGGGVRQYSASGDDLGVFAGGLSFLGAIAADPAGNIYVSEDLTLSGPGRISKFSPSGQLLLTLATPFAIAGVRVGNDGTIYVANYFGHAVHHYAPSGLDLGVFVSLPASGRADFITFDANGYLYVTDFVSHAIRRISPAGVDLGNFITGIAGSVARGSLGSS